MKRFSLVLVALFLMVGLLGVGCDDDGAAEDSPFGFHPATAIKPGYPDNGFMDAENIGVRWHRSSVYVFWFTVQPDLGQQVYDFSSYDVRFGNVPQGVHILANIGPEAQTPLGYTISGTYLPVDETAYAAFVRAVVERYDGDGIGEENFDGGVFPNPIKYWQVGNEPRAELSGFSDLQRITYQAIKDACPDCQVLIGGATGFPDSFISEFDSRNTPILAQLAGQYVDVFDFHWYGTADGEYHFKDTSTGDDVLDYIRAALAANGFSSDMPIWITEMGSYSGDPFGAWFPLQSESSQAGDYFKRFVYSLSRGVKKIFPAFGLMEGFKFEAGYFDSTGLIYDGEDFGHGTDPDNGGDPGLGVKKLGYFTYKKMTEKLEGADWSTLTPLHDGTDTADHLYLYAIEKDNRDIYIAWWDYFDEPSYSPGDAKDLILSGLNGLSVSVTDMVPNYVDGSQVTNYATAFAVTTCPIEAGEAVIPLTEDPVIIE